jgi:hypothetical protein
VGHERAKLESFRPVRNRDRAGPRDPEPKMRVDRPSSAARAPGARRQFLDLVASGALSL